MCLVVTCTRQNETIVTAVYLGKRLLSCRCQGLAFPSRITNTQQGCTGPLHEVGFLLGGIDRIENKVWGVKLGASVNEED